MDIVYKSPADLKPYEHNAKKHPQEQIDRIADSIAAFGFKRVVVIDSDDVIIAGHGSVLAAQKLGLDKIPCLPAGDLTPEQLKAFRLADNKTAESGWDYELLNLELDGITDIDMGMFGFEKLPEIDIDGFFTETENPAEKKEKEIQCPHCKQYFVP